MNENAEAVFANLLRERLEGCGHLRSCLNCENFISEGERCALVNATPPPSVAARGCEKWGLDIPF